MDTTSLCSPSINVSDHYTCFESIELQAIAMAFNRYIEKNELCSAPKKCAPRELIKIEGRGKKDLWNSIYKRLNKICRYEYCWIDQDFIKMIDDKDLRERITYFTFKPKTTRIPNGWLSTRDINSVMSQYQEFDSSFFFIGALPCDFYTQTRVKYTDIPNYRRVGIVFNLDKHNQSGSHWTALLIDNTIKTIEYFDSAAGSPNRQIKKFIKNVENKTGKKYRYKQNKVVHQRENGECGVYAIYFLIRRLLGKSFDEISSKVIPDKSMNRFRRYIFRPLN
jgi:hypothetical protein